MGFRTTGNQRPFHTICAECGLKLRNAKSKKLGFGPSCFKRHMERKPKKWYFCYIFYEVLMRIDRKGSGRNNLEKWYVG